MNLNKNGKIGATAFSAITITTLCRSDIAIERGIDNTPPPAIMPNLRRLAKGLESIQALLGAPIAISSGFRCPELNQAVGGAPASQHLAGLAADFECPGFGDPTAIAVAVARSTIIFDQMILEFGRWVHVSFSTSPRRRALTIYSSAAGYLDGIVARDGKILV